MQFVNSATTNGAQLSGQQVGALGTVNAPPATGSTGASGVTDVTVASPTTPNVSGSAAPAQMGAQGNFWSQNGGAGLILGGVQVLGNLWNSYQAHKMAKEQMSFAREQWDTNLANQTQTYNTALEDRIRGRYARGTRSEEQLQGEINRHSL